MLPDLHGDGARIPATVAAHVRDVVDRPFALRGAVVRVGVSIGTAVAPDDAGDAEGLLRTAEAAVDVERAAKHPRPVRDAG